MLSKYIAIITNEGVEGLLKVFAKQTTKDAWMSIQYQSDCWFSSEMTSTKIYGML